ncbi:MarR family winged helix-turn-helix transcriptional regulator [Streptococcus cameli]
MNHLITLYQQVYERFSLLYLKNVKKDMDFSDKEYTYLQVIHSRGSITSSDFAGLAHMTRAGATQTLNKFEKQGWVVKERSQTDKRSLTVHLTAEVEEIFKEIDQQLTVIFQDFFGVLTDGEQEQLQQILEKLAKAPIATKGDRHDSKV